MSISKGLNNDMNVFLISKLYDSLVNYNCCLLANQDYRNVNLIPIDNPLLKKENLSTKRCIVENMFGKRNVDRWGMAIEKNYNNPKIHILFIKCIYEIVNILNSK